MNIEEMKEAYSRLKICVVGDFILDEWWRGVVTRINPEAPVPIVDNPVRAVNLGGAGNVLLQLRKLGAQVGYHTVGGYNDVSQVMRCKLHDAGMSGYYYQDSKYTTPHKIRVIGNGQHIVRVDDESAVIDEGIQDEMLEHIEHYANIYDAFVLSDYNKGMLTPRVAKKIISLCRGEDIPVFVNSKAPYVSRFFGCDFFQCNISEYENTECAGEVAYSAKASIITRGADGLDVLIGGAHTQFPAHEVDVVEVSGAGDSVFAVFVLEYLRNKKDGKGKEMLSTNVLVAAELANRAGAIVVQKPGIAHCTVEELCGKVTDV